MSDPTDDRVSDATRSTEAEDEQVHSGADRMPTGPEGAAADANADLDPSVSDNYQRHAAVGAAVDGEGKIG